MLRDHPQARARKALFEQRRLTKQIFLTTLCTLFANCVDKNKSSQSARIEASMLPTRQGYHPNEGCVPPELDIDLPDQMFMALELPGSEFASDSIVIGHVRVTNHHSNLPFAYSAVGDLDWITITLVTRTQTGEEVARQTVGEPRYKNRPGSGVSSIWRIHQGEYVNFPIALRFGLIPGDYLIRPEIHVSAGRAGTYPLLNSSDWNGTVAGSPVHVTIRPRPTGHCNAPQARFVATRSQVIPQPNGNKQLEQKWPHLGVALSRAESSVKLRDGWVGFQLSITNLTKDRCFPYSPANWHRSMADLCVDVVLKHPGKAEETRRIPIDDPPELGPQSSFAPPLDGLPPAGSIVIPFELYAGEAGGEGATISCEIRSREFASYANGYVESFWSNSIELIDKSGSQVRPKW